MSAAAWDRRGASIFLKPPRARPTRRRRHRLPPPPAAAAAACTCERPRCSLCHPCCCCCHSSMLPRLLRTAAAMRSPPFCATLHAAGEEGSPMPPPARPGPPAREYPFKIDPFQQVRLRHDCMTCCGLALALATAACCGGRAACCQKPASAAVRVQCPRCSALALTQTAVNALEAGHSVLVAAHTSGWYRLGALMAAACGRKWRLHMGTTALRLPPAPDSTPCRAPDAPGASLCRLQRSAAACF